MIKILCWPETQREMTNISLHQTLVPDVHSVGATIQQIK